MFFLLKVAALPESLIPKILSEKNGDRTSAELEEIEKLSKLFNNELNENKTFFNLNSLPKSTCLLANKSLNNNGILNNDLAEQQQHQQIIASSMLEQQQQKGLFKIELDDVGEKDEIYLLFDSTFSKKKGFYACSTE